MDVPEAELLQGNSLDLGELLLCQLVVEAVAGEEVETNPRGHPTRSAFPLQCVGPRHPRVLQALHAFGRVVPEHNADSSQTVLERIHLLNQTHTRLPLFLHLSRVDDINHVVDGYRGLRYVGGDDDLGDALGGAAENRLLLLIG